MSYKFDGSKVFFTSDTHFYHGNIIRFCNRPFKDVEMMNETIISNWNNTVGQDDIVRSGILIVDADGKILKNMIDRKSTRLNSSHRT